MAPKTLKPKPVVSDLVIRGGTNLATVSTACIVRFPVAPQDPSADQSLRLVEESGVLDFWNSEEEDGYSQEDGEPV